MINLSAFVGCIDLPKNGQKHLIANIMTVSAQSYYEAKKSPMLPYLCIFLSKENVHLRAEIITFSAATKEATKTCNGLTM